MTGLKRPAFALVLLLNLLFGLPSSAADLQAAVFNHDSPPWMPAQIQKGWALGPIRIAQSPADLKNLEPQSILILSFAPASLPTVGAILVDLPTAEYFQLLHNSKPTLPMAQVREAAMNLTLRQMAQGTIPTAIFIDEFVSLVGQITPDEKTLLTTPQNLIPWIEKFGLPGEITAPGVAEISKEICHSPVMDLESIEVFQSEGAFAREPWVQEVKMTFKQKVLTLPYPSEFLIGPKDFSYVGHPFMHHGPWDLSFELTTEAEKRMGFRSFNIYEWNSWTLSTASDSYQWPPDVQVEKERCLRVRLYQDGPRTVRAAILERAFN